MERGSLSRSTVMLLAAGCGAVAALGQAPFSLAPAIVFGLAAASLLLALARDVRAAALVGWAAGFGYFVVALHWIVEPFLVDPTRHGWMAPFALILFNGGLALFWMLAFSAAAWLARPALRPLALAFTLPAAEWLRSTIFSGFPWVLPAQAWSDTFAVHALAFVGPHGLNLLTMLAAAGVALSLRRGRGALWALTLIGPLIAVVALGWWSSRSPMPALGEGPVIRLVQPNAPQNEKWDPGRAEAFVDRQIQFTAAAPAPSLVIWPETAIPWTLGSAGPVLERASEAAGGAPLILGAIRLEGLRAYNALAVVGGDGEVEEIYDKHHLVPFGEYIPLGGFARMIGLRSFAARDGYGYTAGPGSRPLDLGPRFGTALPLICYEAIFPAEIGAVERPDWLLQITNDAWFGTFSGPYQHLEQARMRAVEQGLPMVRVANTGVSAVIDARGKIVASLPLGEAGYIDAALPPKAEPTLYSRTGDAPALAALSLGLIGLWFRRKLR